MIVTLDFVKLFQGKQMMADKEMMSIANVEKEKIFV